jgi:hypothetical protein
MTGPVAMRIFPVLGGKLPKKTESAPPTFFATSDDTKAPLESAESVREKKTSRCI